jgi:hypothetical protein
MFRGWIKPIKLESDDLRDEIVGLNGEHTLVLYGILKEA